MRTRKLTIWSSLLKTLILAVKFPLFRSALLASYTFLEYLELRVGHVYMCVMHMHVFRLITTFPK